MARGYGDSIWQNAGIFGLTSFVEMGPEERVRRCWTLWVSASMRSGCDALEQEKNEELSCICTELV
jgi:hypothetical protein